MPVVLVLGAIATVTYADHIVVSISLVYLCTLPFAVSAIFLRREISYSLIAACILFHDYCSPRYINPGLRIFHKLSAMLCFAFVVWVRRQIFSNPTRSQVQALTANFILRLRQTSAASSNRHTSCVFQIGRVVAYQTRRAAEMDPHTIDFEVGTLLNLLEGLGLEKSFKKSIVR